MILLGEDLLKERTGITTGNLGDVLGSSVRHDRAAAVAALGTHIDDTVSRLDDIKVVLDDKHGVAGVDKTLKNLEQLTDILEMKTRSGLVQNIERFARLAFLELAGKLDALRLATGKRRCRLAKLI